MGQVLSFHEDYQDMFRKQIIVILLDSSIKHFIRHFPETRLDVWLEKNKLTYFDFQAMIYLNEMNQTQIVHGLALKVSMQTFHDVNMNWRSTYK